MASKITMTSLASRNLVESAYMCMLGRMPENDGVLEFLQSQTNTAVLNSILHSEEYRLRNGRNPLFHLNSSLNCEAIIHAHASRDAAPQQDLCVNFLGVKISPKFLPSILDPMVGIVDRVPIPANWHADTAEWAAALRAVDLATEQFNMLELGCGWGCWMVNTGVAARNAGLRFHVAGVEADRGHLAFAEEACRLNDFSKSQFTLRRGVASARPGFALFPHQDRPGENWGNEPVFDATPEQADELCSSGMYEKLPNVPLADFYGEKILDLVHIDIQGGEGDFIAASIENVSKHVKYLVIGTHSREIEGRLFQILLAHGWQLEIERPAIINVHTDRPYTMIDGVQGWRNTRLKSII